MAMRIYDRVGDAAELVSSFQRTEGFAHLIYYFNYTIAGLLDPLYPHGNAWSDAIQQYVGPRRNMRLTDDDKVRELLVPGYYY